MTRIFFAMAFANNGQGQDAFERLNHNVGTLFHYVEETSTSLSDMISTLENKYGKPVEFIKFNGGTSAIAKLPDHAQSSFCGARYFLIGSHNIE